MRHDPRNALVLLGLVMGIGQGAPAFAEWSGYIAGEAVGYTQEPLDARQHGNNLSLAFEPELLRESADGRDRFTLRPFLRIDQHDDERSHADLRELLWLRIGDTWELRTGIGKVFWGVTESRHLVDIINQTDLVENLDGEDKLGQPLLQLSLFRRWGNLDAFMLPGFRERTFAGVEGRSRTQPRVDTEQARYEAGGGRDNLDLALRWSHYFGVWDVGVSLFHGTGRDPLLRLGTDNGETVLVPVYVGIDQWGIDAQATIAAWLWKLEAIHRRTELDSFNATVGGFEYTIFGIVGKRWDLGLLGEYLYDDRGPQADTPFANDLFLGLRLALNDEQSSELLGGVIADLDQRSRFYTLEASRRLGQAWTVSVEARWIEATAPDDPLHGQRDDDHLRLELARHF